MYVMIMRKYIFLLFALMCFNFTDAQEKPPFIKIGNFIRGGSPSPGESTQIGSLKIDYTWWVNCQNVKNGYGYLWTSWEIERYLDKPLTYPSNHLTIPSKASRTYQGYPVWVRVAKIDVPDNVTVIDFESSYITRAYFNVGRRAKIKEIHIPKEMRDFEIEIEEGFASDILFYMESTNPDKVYRGKYYPSYYEKTFKQCVFIVPNGSVEQYKKIDRFGYARIYTNVEGYYADMKKGVDPRALKPESVDLSDYVDLGLPSGTLWKSKNEDDLITYDWAMTKYGSNMPTKEQWTELKKNCSWSWTGRGYRITGTNGNSIYLQAENHFGCHGQRILTGNGPHGFYWSSTANGAESAWSLQFSDFDASIEFDYSCLSGSIRLVIND